MGKYKYTARDESNKTVHGVEFAISREELYTTLRKQGLVLVNARETISAKSRRLKNLELSDFAREMADMLASGIAVADALRIAKDRDMKPHLSQMYERLYNDIQKGVGISLAMEQQDGVFPPLFVNMVRAGEESGSLDKIMNKMALYYANENKVSGKLKMAMIYPCVLLGVTVLMVLIIFLFVLPPFFELFQGMELPLITKIVLGISNGLVKYGLYILAALIPIGIFLRTYMAQYSVRIRNDRRKLKIPVMGKLLSTIYTSRFASTLSALYTSGLSMPLALEITGTIIGNCYIESQMAGVISDVKSGESLAQVIGKIQGLNKKLASVVVIGQESGRLDSLLDALSDSFSYESEVATEQMIALINPVMILVMAVVIGTIMMSVMMPILSLYSNVGNM